MTAHEGGAVWEVGCKVAGGGSRKSIHVKEVKECAATECIELAEACGRVFRSGQI